MRKAFSAIIAAAALAGGFNAAHAQAPAPAQPASCDPVGGMGFICTANRPEDLVQIGDTKWIVATGFQDGAGLKLVDTNAKTAVFWYTGAKAQIRHDKRAYRNCPGPLDIKTFNVQGINLRKKADGAYTLFATNHGGRETIEVFDVALRANEAPTLTWRGCVVSPVAINSVVSFSDGQLLGTNLTRPGTVIADYMRGENTGAVYSWKPGEAQFSLLPGTELPGNNGIEASLDEKNFYVVSFGLKQIVEFSRADPSKPLRRADTPGFMPDNIRWTNGKLVAAGMMTDEPACGGLRKVEGKVADSMQCHRGWVAAWLDPASFKFRVLAYGGPNPGFNGLSTAIVVGRELWLGSWQRDRIAYLPLPGETTP